MGSQRCFGRAARLHLFCDESGHGSADSKFAGCVIVSDFHDDDDDDGTEIDADFNVRIAMDTFIIGSAQHAVAADSKRFPCKSTSRAKVAVCFTAQDVEQNACNAMQRRLKQF